MDMRTPGNRSTFRVPRRQVRVTGTPIQPRSSVRGGLIEATCTSTPLQPQNNSVIAPSITTFNNAQVHSVSHAYPRINVYEHVDQTLFLDPGNYELHQITKPAMLLRDALQAAFQMMRTNRVTSISKPQMEQLQMLFDFLIASAHTASAETLTKQYSSNSRTKSPDRSLSVRKYRYPKFQKQPITSRSIETKSLPYLEKENMNLETIVGSVRAKILSARSFVNSKTLAFIFEYCGNEVLGLSPFVVDYVSHELTSRFQRVSGQQLSNPGLNPSHAKLLTLITNSPVSAEPLRSPTTIMSSAPVGAATPTPSRLAEEAAYGKLPFDRFALVMPIPYSRVEKFLPISVGSLGLFEGSRGRPETMG